MANTPRILASAELKRVLLNIKGLAKNRNFMAFSANLVFLEVFLCNMTT